MHKRILLIDDDVDDQVIFLDALSEITLDVECIIVNNGLDALTNLKMLNPSPSLIFLDINMPLMNGFECLKEIRKDYRLKKVPVIIYSTSNNPIDVKQAEELGVEMFFTKTPDFKLLKLKLHDILKEGF